MLLTACCSFQLYDDALPPDSGNFLFNWSDDDCSILNALAWFRPAREAAARAHRRIFDDVIAPIFQSELRQVGNVTFDEFMRLYSIVSSRAFGDSQDSTLIPVFDLLNGISCGAASCHLCQHSFPVSPTQQLPLQAIDTLSEVRCGQEILLEYAELPSHLFLLNYDFLPLHPAYVISNATNETLVHSSNFFDNVTQWRHPTDAAVRQRIRDFLLQHLALPAPFAPLSFESEEQDLAALRQVRP